MMAGLGEWRADDDANIVRSRKQGAGKSVLLFLLTAGGQTIASSAVPDDGRWTMDDGRWTMDDSRTPGF
jgi:hypothetical protein